MRRAGLVGFDERLWVWRDGNDQEAGQRLVDFCAGGVSAMDGQAHRAGENAFLFVPALTRVTAP